MAGTSLTEQEYEPIRRALFERSNGSASSAKAALAECLAEDGYALVKLDTPHVAVFTEDRWLVEHSARCRLEGRMAECEYHAAVERVADDMQNELGRWRILDVDSEGLPFFEAEV